MCLNPPSCVVYAGLAVCLSSVGSAAGLVMCTTGPDGALVAVGRLPPVGLFLPCQINGVEMNPREVLELRWLGGLGRESGGLGRAGSGRAGGSGAESLVCDAGSWVGGLD